MISMKRKLSVILGLGILIISLILTLSSVSQVYGDTNQGSTGLKRLYGNDSVGTAIEIAKELKSSANTFIIVTDNDFPDALAGTVLASKLKAPILFISEQDSQKTFDYLKEAGVNTSTKFIILGGEGAISKDIENKLAIMTKTPIERIYGANRYDTAAKINEYLNVPKNTPIVIATGQNYPDALAISSIAGLKQYPIFLTSNDSISDSQANVIGTIKPSDIYIVGGTGVVPKALEPTLQHAAGVNSKITRFNGANRYDTMSQIYKMFKDDTKVDMYTTGLDFHDALAAAPLAVDRNAMIILADNNDYKTQMFNSRKTGYIIGSTEVLGDNLKGYLEGSVTPVLSETDELTKYFNFLNFTDEKEINNLNLTTDNLYQSRITKVIDGIPYWSTYNYNDNSQHENYRIIPTQYNPDINLQVLKLMKLFMDNSNNWYVKPMVDSYQTETANNRGVTVSVYNKDEKYKDKEILSITLNTPRKGCMYTKYDVLLGSNSLCGVSFDKYSDILKKALEILEGNGTEREAIFKYIEEKYNQGIVNHQQIGVWDKGSNVDSEYIDLANGNKKNITIQEAINKTIGKNTIPSDIILCSADHGNYDAYGLKFGIYYQYYY